MSSRVSSGYKLYTCTGTPYKCTWTCTRIVRDGTPYKCAFCAFGARAAVGQARLARRSKSQKWVEGRIRVGIHVSGSGRRCTWISRFAGEMGARGRVPFEGASLWVPSQLFAMLFALWRLHASRRPVSVTARLAADRLMVPAHHRHRTQCALSLYNRECALCSPDARRFSASDLNAPHALSQLYVIWLQIRIL